MNEQHNHYDVRDKVIEDKMKELATKISSFLPKSWGFNLLIFEYNQKDGAVFYISSAEKQNVIEMLEKEVERLKTL